MTLREASAVLGVKVRTIRKWLEEGKIKAVKTGKQWEIPQEEISRKKTEMISKTIKNIMINPAREVDKEIRLLLYGEEPIFDEMLFKKNVSDLVEFVKNNDHVSGMERYEYINSLMYAITCDAVSMIMNEDANEN